ncbi:MAG: HEPN domain-containing protein [Syntrophaceae bacterium]|nr:HEPN domain-containing protein [Syntrophaceae bacterium]
MPRDLSKLGTPRVWLTRAKSNLIRSKQPKPEEVLWEDLCFDTQQAVEKALKAVLLARGISFRFVHDIAELITLLENQGIILPEEIKASAELTDYSVESRYPGPFEPVTEEEFKKALRIAEAVVAWAESQIEQL